MKKIFFFKFLDLIFIINVYGRDSQSLLYQLLNDGQYGIFSAKAETLPKGFQRINGAKVQKVQPDPLGFEVEKEIQVHRDYRV